jgi:hypothetical protein
LPASPCSGKVFSIQHNGLLQQDKYKQILDKLAKLSEAADREGNSKFKSAIDGFRNDLQKKLEMGPSSYSLSLTLAALEL